MEVQVLGSCCGSCDKLLAAVNEVIAEKNLSASVRKVTDLQEVLALGLFSLPGLVVDGRLVAHGRVPAKDEIAALLGA